MTDHAPPQDDAREVMLGIDLRDRAERLIAAAEAFAAAAISLRRWALAGLLGGLLVLAAIALLFSEVQDNITSGHQTRDQIVDCVTPGGVCYQRGQDQTVHLLDVLNQQGIARGVCLQEDAAVKPLESRDAAVTQCVAQLTK